MKPLDANGFPIVDGSKVRFTGTVEIACDRHSVRVKPDRQPRGYTRAIYVPPDALEVVDDD